jgi:hypothetical protein
VAAVWCSAVVAFEVRSDQDPPYTIAFASFAPLNADIFIADADGSNERALVSPPDLDSIVRGLRFGAIHDVSQ